MALHFTISREELLRAVGGQQNIAGKKQTLAILANILLIVEQDRVVFIATDLDMALKTTVPADVVSPGILTLPAKKLYEVARESSESTITLQEDENNWVTITSGSSLYKLAGTAPDEFPDFPEYSQENSFEVDSELMEELIDKVYFSIAQDNESMFTLTAALFQKIERDEKKFLQMVSSDGHRLSIMEREYDGSLAGVTFPDKVLIPKPGVKEIGKFCEDCPQVTVAFDGDRIIFEKEGSQLVIRLIEGDFPNFQAIIETIVRENVLYIDREKFLESLKRINLFTEDLFHAIRMEIDGDTMILTSQNSDFGSAKDELEIEYTGEPMTLGFNCRYFIEALQVMAGDRIEAVISSNEGPCLITSEGDPGFLSIIMPMKL